MTLKYRNNTGAAAISRFRALISEIPTPDVKNLKELLKAIASAFIDDELQVEFLTRGFYCLKSAIENVSVKFEITKRQVVGSGWN